MESWAKENNVDASVIWERIRRGYDSARAVTESFEKKRRNRFSEQDYRSMLLMHEAGYTERRIGLLFGAAVSVVHGILSRARRGVFGYLP